MFHFQKKLIPETTAIGGQGEGERGGSQIYAKKQVKVSLTSRKGTMQNFQEEKLSSEINNIDHTELSTISSNISSLFKANR